MTDIRTPSGKRNTGGKTVWRFLPILIVVAGLVFGYMMGWQRYFSFDVLVESRATLKALVAEHPIAAPLAFIGVYASAVALSFPAASILTIFGGFLFGWLLGGILVAIAATLGATAIFLAARSAFGDVLRARVKGRAAQLADGFERDAFGYLLALRLAPVVPFFVLNIAPALFKVPLRTYVGATAIGILPGVFAYSYLGRGLDSAVIAAQQAGRNLSPKHLLTPQVTIAFVLLAVVALIPTLVKRWRRRDGR